MHLARLLAVSPRLLLSLFLAAASAASSMTAGAVLFVTAFVDALAPEGAKGSLALLPAVAAAVALSGVLAFGAVRAWDWFRRYCWRHERDGCGVCRERAELDKPSASTADADRLQAWRERSGRASGPAERSAGGAAPPPPK